MNPEFILTFSYQVNFWSKEKINLLKKNMANRSLLDYFAFQ